MMSVYDIILYHDITLQIELSLFLCCVRQCSRSIRSLLKINDNYNTNINDKYQCRIIFSIYMLPFKGPLKEKENMDKQNYPHCFVSVVALLLLSF